MNNIVTIVLPVVAAQPIRIPYADAGQTQSRNSQYICIDIRKNHTRIAAAYNHSMFMLLIT